jgi:hypothetical protein
VPSKSAEERKECDEESRQSGVFALGRGQHPRTGSYLGFPRLRKQASTEAKKLAELVREINRLLKEKHQGQP